MKHQIPKFETKRGDFYSLLRRKVAEMGKKSIIAKGFIDSIRGTPARTR